LPARFRAEYLAISVCDATILVSVASLSQLGGAICHLSLELLTLILLLILYEFFDEFGLWILAALVGVSVFIDELVIRVVVLLLFLRLILFL